MGRRWERGAAGRPLWGEAGAAPCWSEPVLAGPAAAPPQGPAQPLSHGGGTPGITCFSKGETPQRQRGVRKKVRGTALQKTMGEGGGEKVLQASEQGLPCRPRWVHSNLYNKYKKTAKMAFLYCKVKYASITTHKNYFLSLKESPAIWCLYWPDTNVSFDLANKVSGKALQFPLH